MSLLFIISAVLLSCNICAQNLLTKSLITAQSLYSLGEGGSYIEHAVMSFKEFQQELEDAPISPVSASKDELALVIKECVMIKESAYESLPHLSDRQQETLAKKYAHILLQQTKFSYFRIPGKELIPGPLSTAPCALAIRCGDEVIVMQGGIID